MILLSCKNSSQIFCRMDGNARFVLTMYGNSSSTITFFLVRLVCCDRTKQVSPIRKRHIAKQRIPSGSCDHTGHSLHALRLNLLRGEEIYGRLILDKFL